MYTEKAVAALIGISFVLGVFFTFVFLRKKLDPNIN